MLQDGIVILGVGRDGAAKQRADVVGPAKLYVSSSHAAISFTPGIEYNISCIVAEQFRDQMWVPGRRGVYR